MTLILDYVWWWHSHGGVLWFIHWVNFVFCTLPKQILEATYEVDGWFCFVRCCNEHSCYQEKLCSFNELGQLIFVNYWWQLIGPYFKKSYASILYVFSITFNFEQNHKFRTGFFYQNIFFSFFQNQKYVLTWKCLGETRVSLVPRAPKKDIPAVITAGNFQFPDWGLVSYEVLTSATLKKDGTVSAVITLITQIHYTHGNLFEGLLWIKILCKGLLLCLLSWYATYNPLQCLFILMRLIF